MAALTLSVGPLTSAAQADDTKAAEILTLYAKARGAPETLTNAQRLAFVRDALVAHLRAVAREQRIREEEEAARVVGQTAAAALDWLP